jgi:hypothetical protein
VKPSVLSPDCEMIHSFNAATPSNDLALAVEHVEEPDSDTFTAARQFPPTTARPEEHNDDTRRTTRAEHDNPVTFQVSSAALAGYLISRGFLCIADEQRQLFTFEAAAAGAARKWARTPRRYGSHEKRVYSKHVDR